MLQDVGERLRVMLAGRMRDDPRRLLDDDDPGIGVLDAEVERLGRQQLVGGLQQANADPLPLADAIGLRCGSAVDGGSAGPDNPLQPPGRVVPKVPFQEAVNANPAEFTLDNQLGGEGGFGVFDFGFWMRLDRVPQSRRSGCA